LAKLGAALFVSGQDLSTYVALLRGINVGKNLLPMPALAEMFTRAGCKNVRTYIQSGNVLFDASGSVLKSLCSRVGTAIFDAYGFRSPVILRSSEELSAVTRSNPFMGEPEQTLHVLVLDNTPAAADAAGLDAMRSTPDRFHLLGREIYLHLPNGAGRSKLTNAYFDSKLRAVSTMRNWRTVNQLLALMNARSPNGNT
jgi:uncharacterized protein (DUF1697 family)